MKVRKFDCLYVFASEFNQKFKSNSKSKIQKNN